MVKDAKNPEVVSAAPAYDGKLHAQLERDFAKMVVRVGELEKHLQALQDNQQNFSELRREMYDLADDGIKTLNEQNRKLEELIDIIAYFVHMFSEPMMWDAHNTFHNFQTVLPSHISQILISKLPARHHEKLALS